MTARILLVEPDIATASEEASSLREAGFSVQVAPDGETAVAQADPQVYDLVLMEADLGSGMSGSGVSGIVAAQRILSAHDLPIVFLTARDDEATIAAIRKITRYGLVFKRSGYTVLQEVIRLALELFREHQALRHSRDLFHSITDLTGDVIVRHDPEGRWVFLNRRAREIWNVEDQDISQLNYLDYVAAEDLEATTAAAVTMRSTQQIISGLVNQITTVEGVRTYQWNSAPIFDEFGAYAGFQATGRDITEAQELTRRIQSLLDERDLLLQEIHHRVKNDLSLVQSLLSLQAQESDNLATRNALQEAGDRLSVIARIYSSLSHSTAEGTVSVQPIIEQIAQDIVRYTQEQVAVQTTVEPLVAPARTMITLGIIINELVTNALKYAVPPTESPELKLEVYEESRESGNRIIVAFEDNGPGFPEEIVSRHRYGFGLSIVQSLLSQYEGTLEITNSGGGRVRISLLPG